ncbi:MAG: hypothetical protein Q8N42_02015 [bacterium]|nr:hypothetical protein [bacterium]
MRNLKECTKVKTIPCEWRVEETLCNAPEEIDCHYAEPLEDEGAPGFETELPTGDEIAQAEREAADEESEKASEYFREHGSNY